MAKDTGVKLNILSAESRRKLEALGSDLDRAEKTIELLKEIGIGVTDLESKIQWAKKRRDILLARG